MKRQNQDELAKAQAFAEAQQEKAQALQDILWGAGRDEFLEMRAQGLGHLGNMAAQTDDPALLEHFASQARAAAEAAEAYAEFLRHG
jgi:hypothetical protein